MVMEKPSPLDVGQEFVRQYYTVLKKAPASLHRFYGRSSSFVHGGLDPNGKLAEAVYEHEEIRKKIKSLQFSECCTKIWHVDAHGTLSDGVVVQVLGELSNSGQPMRKFMQTFVLALDGSSSNTFYVHHNIFRYEDEVFGNSHAEHKEESEEAVEKEPKERQPSPEPHPDTNGVEGPMEEPAPEPEPDPKAEEINSERENKVLEEIKDKTPSQVHEESPTNTQEASKTSSWILVTSKNHSQKEKRKASRVAPSDVPPHVDKSTPPRVEMQTTPLHPKEQRTRDRLSVPPRGPRPGGRDGEPGVIDNRRVVRHPDSHQLFVGNLPQDIVKRELKEFFMTYGNVVNLWINTKSVGGKLPNFGFVVFDNSDSVQRILEAQVEGPIMFQDKVRLKVKERKPRAVREQETLPGRVDMAPKLSMGSGRGAGGQGEGRFRTQRR
ncbi:ras GTPase-activating protein-binding protein 2-like [Gouania willdenowi]|uniref:ras GTPase-activating protein-binding protein 2-like n=1 Tax=Gouania willdenowi TaxID=441366 RepID=UPI0010551387|nr:ras GTPase-activating protein-binding protein 2-like [Gouania willdenowi]XP_028296943.1 ras GTPase-activating protein-binding protein 2-like [Gouania willdenowi]XP_028296944.1 ras GTPase-activating protein-binding protein 2-like [Gouania willdenowi]XP_028296945.1 ras GTPase-activating protein-binding protein 2-like [Gouania willdenowi]